MLELCALRLLVCGPMVIAISSYFDTEPQSLYWSSFNKGQVRSEVAREAASLAEKAKKLLRFCET